MDRQTDGQQKLSNRVGDPIKGVEKFSELLLVYTGFSWPLHRKALAYYIIRTTTENIKYYLDNVIQFTTITQ